MPCAKFGWNVMEKTKIWKVYRQTDSETDRRTTGDQKNLILAFGSSELKF